MFAIEKLEAVRRNVVVVFGGYKKNQEKDVKRLYKIVEEVKDEIEELIKEKK